MIIFIVFEAWKLLDSAWMYISMDYSKVMQDLNTSCDCFDIAFHLPRSELLLAEVLPGYLLVKRRRLFAFFVKDRGCLHFHEDKFFLDVPPFINFSQAIMNYLRKLSNQLKCFASLFFKQSGNINDCNHHKLVRNISLVY